MVPACGGLLICDHHKDALWDKDTAAPEYENRVSSSDFDANSEVNLGVVWIGSWRLAREVRRRHGRSMRWKRGFFPPACCQGGGVRRGVETEGTSAHHLASGIRSATGARRPWERPLRHRHRGQRDERKGPALWLKSADGRAPRSAALRQLRGGHHRDCAAWWGLCRVPSYQVAEDLKIGSLVAVFEAHEPIPMPVQIIHPARRRTLAELRAFVDFFGERLRKLPALRQAGWRAEIIRFPECSVLWLPQACDPTAFGDGGI